MYPYVLKTGTFSGSRKMLLIKEEVKSLRVIYSAYSCLIST